MKGKWRGEEEGEGAGEERVEMEERSERWERRKNEMNSKRIKRNSKKKYIFLYYSSFIPIITIFIKAYLSILTNHFSLIFSSFYLSLYISIYLFMYRFIILSIYISSQYALGVEQAANC